MQDLFSPGGIPVLGDRILSACLGISPLGAITDEELPQLLQWGFAPWLALWLDQGYAELDKSPQASVCLAAQGACIHARTVRNHLEELLVATSKAGISICLLKGAALEPWLYPQAGFRPMGDIDVLVTGHQQEAFETILRKHGYRQQSARPASYYSHHHHSMPFRHEKLRVWIEVHTRLYPDIANTLRLHQEPLEFGDASCQRLTAHAQALYTVAHWADPFPGSKGLIGLIDLGLLVKASGMPDMLAFHFDAAQKDWLLRALDIATTLLPVNTTTPNNSQHSSLDKIRKNLLRTLANDHVLNSHPDTRWRSQATIATCWEALMNTSNPAIALGKLPWWLLFPPGDTRRFSPVLLGRRLSRLWRTQL